MRVRPVLAAALAGSLAVGGIAVAAPKAKPKPKPVPPSCNLVVDEKGDTAVTPFPASDTIDIVSADVANDAKAITAVLRVAKYTPNDLSTIYGKRYIVSFEGAGLKGMYLRALDYPGNAVPGGEELALPFDFGATEVDATTGGTTYTSAGPATGSINASTGEITVTAQLSELAAAGFGKIVPGQQIKGLNAITFRRVGNRLFEGDTATSSKRYTAGAPSCVKVG